MYDPPEQFDPERKPDLGRLFSTIAQVTSIGFGILLTLVALYLALDLYAIIARYVGSPDELNNALAAFDSSSPAVTETQLANPDESGQLRDDPVVSFASFINGIVDELSSGRLARPIGAFILFLFLTILIRIVLTVLGYGIKLIIAVLPNKPDDDDDDDKKTKLSTQR